MRRRLLNLSAPLGLVTLAACLGLGCAKDPGPMTWPELQAAYFDALSLQDDTKRQALPDFEQRLENIAKGIVQKNDVGDLTDDVERTESGLALLYQSYLLQAGQQALQDGTLKAADLLTPQRYAAGGGDQSELAARLARSTALLKLAAELRPDDQRVATLGVFGRYNSESLSGTHSPSLQLELLDAAQRDQFSLFGTMLLWRDNDDNPANAANVQQLITILCSPSRFNCNQPAEPPPRAIDGERKLTQEVNGPVLVSDLLVRDAETLVASADNMMNPASRTPLLNKAMSRLQYAKSTVGFVTTNVQDPALSQYPASKHLADRADRIDQIIGATQARLDGTDQPALPDTDYYKSAAYRSAYQCVACHTKGTTTVGFPK